MFIKNNLLTFLLLIFIVTSCNYFNRTGNLWRYYKTVVNFNLISENSKHLTGATVIFNNEMDKDTALEYSVISDTLNTNTNWIVSQELTGFVVEVDPYSNCDSLYGTIIKGKLSLTVNKEGYKTKRVNEVIKFYLCKDIFAACFNDTLDPIYYTNDLGDLKLTKK